MVGDELPLYPLANHIGTLLISRRFEVIRLLLCKEVLVIEETFGATCLLWNCIQVAHTFSNNCIDLQLKSITGRTQRMRLTLSSYHPDILHYMNTINMCAAEYRHRDFLLPSVQDKTKPKSLLFTNKPEDTLSSEFKFFKEGDAVIQKKKPQGDIDQEKRKYEAEKEEFFKKAKKNTFVIDDTEVSDTPETGINSLD